MVRAIVVLALFLTACDATVDEAVTLTYAPEVGSTYRYTIRTSADKEGQMIREVLRKTGEGFEERLVSSGFEEVEETVVYVSSTYRSHDKRIFDLDFPAHPVHEGDTWKGTIPFELMHSFTEDRPEIQATHVLEAVREGSAGRYCEILTRPTEATGHFEMSFKLGQIGVKCDLDGSVREVVSGFGAEGRVQVGDRVTGINGVGVNDAGERNAVAQDQIESILTDKTVVLSLVRGGQPLDVSVEKVINEVADIRVGYTSFGNYIRSRFDVERGILISQKVHFDVMMIYPVSRDLAQACR